MNLYVSKATFLKNLEKDSGIAFSVIDCDNLRENIQKIAHNDLLEAISTKDTETIEKSFSDILDYAKNGNKDDIHIFIDFTRITNIKSSYIIQLYNDSKLSSLVEKDIIYSQKNHEDAFKLKLIELYLSNEHFEKRFHGKVFTRLGSCGFISFVNMTNREYNSSLRTSDKAYIRAKNILAIDLSDDIRNKIIDDFKYCIKIYLSSLLTNLKTFKHNPNYYGYQIKSLESIIDIDLESIYQKARKI